MIISRHWGMPSADTFDCAPIEGFVKKYLMKSKVSVDPFARNKRWCTFTNDLNPNTQAEYHMEAADFLEMLVQKGITADLVIFDPPYSLRQSKEMYEEIGIKFGFYESHNVGRWNKEKELITQLDANTVLSFGWNSIGMGKNTGWSFRPFTQVHHIVDLLRK